MRFKNIACLAVTGLLLISAAGCRRKEEPDIEPPPGPEAVKIPEAFQPIPETVPQVYISVAPVTVGQYLRYLSEMGYHDTQRHAKEEHKEGEPLTGIDFAEAERFAVWKLSRLPDEDEWARAVGAGLIDVLPYPWDGPSPRADVPVYFARDWLEGSRGETEAIERKEELIENRVAQLNEEISELGRTVGELVLEKKDRLRTMWREIKSELFASIDLQKETARKALLVERSRNLAEEILGSLKEKKLPLRTLKLDEEYDETRFQELLEDYRRYLEEWRNRSQEQRTRLVEINNGLSERVRSIKQRIEQIMEEKLDIMPEPPAEPAGISQIEEAVAAREELLGAAGKAEAGFTKCLETLNAVREDIMPGIRELPELDEQELDSVRAKIAETEDTITRWSDAIEVEFEQEPHLFGDLRDLKHARARNEALKHELELLEKIVEQMQ